MSRIASFDTAAFNGAFGRDLERRRQECRALGLTQRQHALTVALPRYARKVAGVLAQQPLWRRTDYCPRGRDTRACLNSLGDARTQGRRKPNPNG